MNNRGRDITLIDLEKEVRDIARKAMEQALYEPSDDFTVANIRAAIANGMSALKTRGVIKGYILDLQLEGIKVIGSITFTPIQVVKNVVVNFGISNNNNGICKIAMKGI